MAEGSSYVRFIVVGGPRTGSSMLVQALNSSPRITCFREVFNGRLDFVDFSVEGYDNFSSRERTLRSDDPVRFLRERVFCPHPERVRAVGFKFLYGQHWDFPGIMERLIEDRELRVLDLRRHNPLRMLVSFKLAQLTGVWAQRDAPNLTRANLLQALRHPMRTLQRIQRRLPPARLPGGGPRPRVTISPEECYTFMVETNMKTARYDELFGDHPKLTLFYEDMVDRRDDLFAEAQSFLGVEPGPLTVTIRRQNPEPLRELIENYDQLYAAFKDTPQAAFFD